MKKIRISIILLLVGAGSALAENQIRVATTFTETVDGKPTVLSTPKIVVVENQEGKIEIGRELIAAPSSPKLAGYHATLQDGIVFTVVAQVFLTGAFCWRDPSVRQPTFRKAFR